MMKNLEIRNQVSLGARTGVRDQDPREWIALDQNRDTLTLSRHVFNLLCALPQTILETQGRRNSVTYIYLTENLKLFLKPPLPFDLIHTFPQLPSQSQSV